MLFCLCLIVLPFWVCLARASPSSTSSSKVSHRGNNSQSTSLPKDFSKEHMDKLGLGIYTPMDISVLPPLHLIYAENPSDSGKSLCNACEIKSRKKRQAALGMKPDEKKIAKRSNSSSSDLSDDHLDAKDKINKDDSNIVTLHEITTPSYV